jgi:peroxiredoxin
MIRVRRTRQIVAPLLLLLAACGGPSLAELAVGQPAPPFELTAVDGRKVALADFRGKVVVLEWMNPGCPFSRHHSEARTMQATAAKHPDAVWLAINSTRADHRDYLAPEAYAKFLAANGITYPVLYDSDGRVGRAYGAKTTPHLYVIDAAGQLAYQGAIDDDPGLKAPKVNYADAALAALAAGGTPEPSTTRPYGCTVKY